MKSVTTGRDLLNLLDLVNVQFYEVSARLDSGFPAGVAAAISSGDTGADQDSATNEEQETGQSDPQFWTFFVHVDNTSVNLRGRLTINAPDAGYAVDAAVFYTAKEEVTIDREALEEFLNRAAMIALYPFVREALHEAGRKIGANPPLLGIYDPQEIQIRLSDPVSAQSD
ncbi:hypothetical protein GCM10027598_27320 [Amycolatopsis oliviviridis]|uniref:Preprotein translocase subunit SecB n=1 Tax=Amycolatopsis oliviviridis TaxID=1471590 RepID=A0ABQ3LJ80_9PSEU|nr:hypothetical protein [Amycolatopsis oliviviridis]GHH17716.1 hypothetical protein GCM10017790_34970 [Amycolatopsis oliviviridis]